MPKKLQSTPCVINCPDHYNEDEESYGLSDVDLVAVLASYSTQKRPIVKTPSYFSTTLAYPPISKLAAPKEENTLISSCTNESSSFLHEDDSYTISDEDLLLAYISCSGYVDNTSTSTSTFASNTIQHENTNPPPTHPVEDGSIDPTREDSYSYRLSDDDQDFDFAEACLRLIESVETSAEP
jgi:hypothetical protein